MQSSYREPVRQTGVAPDGSCAYGSDSDGNTRDIPKSFGQFGGKLPEAISPRLFTPSVSKIITLLIALLSFSLETAVANPVSNGSFHLQSFRFEYS